MNISDLKDYLNCSMLYYLKQHPSYSSEAKANLRSTRVLPRLAIQQCLKMYATGKYTMYSYKEITASIWKKWLSDQGITQGFYDKLRFYGDKRNEILAGFINGEIKDANKEKYTEPRLTHRFQTACSDMNLPRYRQDLEISIAPAIGFTTAYLPELGRYFLADAFADSLIMADNLQKTEPENILGVDKPAVAKLTNGEELELRLALVYRNQYATSAELLDFTPMFARPTERHHPDRLDLTAYHHAVMVDLPEIRLDKIYYRHLMSGSVEGVHRENESELVYAMMMMMRGLENGIYYPQYLGGDYKRCLQCSQYDTCIKGAGISTWLRPETQDYADKLAELGKRLKDLGVPAEVKEKMQELFDDWRQPQFQAGINTILDRD